MLVPVYKKVMHEYVISYRFSISFQYELPTANYEDDNLILMVILKMKNDICF